MLIDLITELERLDREAERKNNMKEKVLCDYTTEELKNELERREKEKEKELKNFSIQENIVKKDYENLCRVLSKYARWYRMVNSNDDADPRDRVYYCHMLRGLEKALIMMVTSYKTSEYTLYGLKSGKRTNPIINPAYVTMKTAIRDDGISLFFYYNGEVIFSSCF